MRWTIIVLFCAFVLIATVFIAGTIAGNQVA